MPIASRLLFAVLLGLFLAFASACSDSSSSDDDRPGQDDPPVDEPPVDDPPDDVDGEGVLLDGDPEAPAVAHTHDLHVPVTSIAGLVSDHPELGPDARVLRTEIELILDFAATVGEVNALLEAYEARITSMTAGVPVMVIGVNDPGDLDGLKALTGALGEERIVLAASKTVLIEDPVMAPDEGDDFDPQQLAALFAVDVLGAQASGAAAGLPDYINPDQLANVNNDGNPARIDHHLAVRGHAAWNLQSLLAPESERPWLIISDLFGAGAPDAAYDITTVAGDYATADEQSHGYHVLGIISAAHQPPDSLSHNGRRDATGMMPGHLNVRAVDTRSDEGNTWAKRRAEMVHRMNAVLADHPDARFVGNTSLNSRSFSSQNRHDQAVAWVMQLRLSAGDPSELGFMDWETLLNLVDTPGSGLEGRLLHFTSSGNMAPANNADWEAMDNSVITYAVLGDLAVDDLVIPNLENTFVVENRTNLHHRLNSGERPEPFCAWESSIMGGNLSAIGRHVWSLGSCTDGFWEGGSFTCTQRSATEPGESTGTSMATPQAAGIAAYAWSVNPDLSVAELYDLIADTASDAYDDEDWASCNSTASAQPVVDAYAALLAAGGDAARIALLDVGGNGVFDENDIALFLDAFDIEAAADGELSLAYGRFDLAGDGLTGTRLQRGEAFDLANSGGASASRVLSTPLGESVTVSYDTSAVSDWDVLCYYAWSDLYTGDTAERDALLSRYCSGGLIRLSVIGDDAQPQTGVPIAIERLGVPVSHDVEKLDDGEFAIWVPAGNSYTLALPDDFEMTGNPLVGTVDDYQLVTHQIQVTPPEVELSLVLPAQGATYTEGSATLVRVQTNAPATQTVLGVAVNGQVVTIHELDESGDQHVDLIIDPLCPRGEVEVVITLEDAFGNEVEQELTLNVTEVPLTVMIDHDGLIEITYDPTAAPHWIVPLTTVEGAARKATCEDPESTNIDQSTLEWTAIDEDPVEALGTGPSLQLGDGFFRETQDTHRSRDVHLAVSHLEEDAETSRTLTPCYGHMVTHGAFGWNDTFDYLIGLSEMQYPAGPVPAEDYPPCSSEQKNHYSGTPIGDLRADLINELQQVEDALAAQALLDDLFDDLLGELGRPEVFPTSFGNVYEFAAHLWDDAVAHYSLLEIHNILNESPQDFRRELGGLKADARSALDDHQYAYFGYVLDIVATKVDLFASPEANGQNIWSSFSFDHDPQTLHKRVDTLAPARAALTAIAEATLITTENANYREGKVGASTEGAVYGAFREALEQTMPPP